MIDSRIGCSGWSYGAWTGPFYPRNTRPEEYLRMYSRAFDSVEIDSTFYHDPKPSTVEAWKRSTPDGFLFTSKTPREITHERRLKESESLMSAFLEHISVLGKKLGCILIQFPPSFSYDEGFQRVRKFIEFLPSDLHFAVEFRNRSWFREDTYSLLANSNITLTWSEVPMVDTPPVSTSSLAYIRLVGDRSIREEDFGALQRDRTSEIKKWISHLNDHREEVRRAFIFSNNHFQGFGPGTVNVVRQAMGLNPVVWFSEMQKSDREGQRTLF